jgi:anti-anti-sigma factor
VASNPNSDIELSEVDGRATVKGDVDLRSAARLEAWLRTFDGQVFEIDMSEVTFFDSSALRALLNVRRTHSGMRLVAASRSVRHVLEITSTLDYLMGD